MATFTDPKKFADHMERQLKEHAIEGMGKAIESKAQQDNPLAVTLTGVDTQTNQAVQAWLRRRGWTIGDAAGNQFTLSR